MKTASGEIDPRDYYNPISVKGHTRWECTLCGKLLARSTKTSHLKLKHAQEIGYVPDTYTPPGPEEIRDIWIKWYESGVHRADLQRRINRDLDRITRTAIEREIGRIVEE